MSVDGWITGNGYRRTVCPYEGCSEVVIDECKGGGRQDCPRCKGVFCFDCGVKWETNHLEKCKREEVVFMNAAKEENLKRCPNCRFFVQRKSGCRYVTCRCGTSFCHKCGVEHCHCLSPELFADIYARIRRFVSSAYCGCFS
ncbi:E3 ubiquitin-protein ligase RSL1-like [Silene latifolia]|uniref:E3 ubiquitin-protein ligase RSL1-like n=1 Tax=Silene latifolia TaxID=37657 RepID=UPI003D773785